MEPVAESSRGRSLPPRWTAELALAGAALAALGFVVFGRHVQHGGFYADDWSKAAAFHFDGWWRTSVDEWRHAIPGRPLLALLHPLPYALFGIDPRYELAMAVVLAAATSLAFFAFLRTVGVELPHSLALAVLSLLFPWNDAAHLWPTASINNVAVIAYLVGSIAALRGLAEWHVNRRRAIALHVAGGLLYLASVLTYEVAGAAIFLSGLLYRTRSSWRELRVRWLADALLVLVPLTVSARLTSPVRHVGSFSERARDVPRFVGAALSLFASVFVPQSVSSSWVTTWRAISASAGKAVVLAVFAGVVAGALVQSRRDSDRDLRRWLYRGTGGACAVAAAYFMFLGSGLVPLFYPGIDDRTNTLAAFGFVVVAYSTVILGARLVSRSARTASLIILTGTLLIGLGFSQRVRRDIGRYDSATIEQRYLLARLQEMFPTPPARSTIFSFGYPAETAPGVPVFTHSWDLRGAVDLLWDDRSIKAVPVYRRPVTCGRKEVATYRSGERLAAAYGRAVFVEVTTRRAKRIRSPAACLRARRLFTPGPVVEPGATHRST